MQRRILSLLLVLIMIITVVPVSFASLESVEYFVINNGVLTSYRGGGGAITIPDTVTTIWENAFRDNKYITSVVIPNSVTKIGGSAFIGCSNLLSVTIPGSVEEIGVRVFYGCTSLKFVTIQDGAKSIGVDMFSGCTDLSSISIPNSMTSIGSGAFTACKSLTAITIPNSVTAIGSRAFENCKGLTSITIPSTVTSIGADVFSGCALTLYGASGSQAQTFAGISGVPFVVGSAPVKTLAAVPTPSKVLVDGTEKKFDSYLIDGSNYFKLRDLAFVLNGTWKQFEVEYDNATASIYLTSRTQYTPVGGELATGDGKTKTPKPTESKVFFNDREVAFDVYLIGGNNYFKLRDMMKLFDVYVGWDSSAGVIELNSSVRYVDP